MSSKLTQHLHELKHLEVITLENIIDSLKDEALLVVCLVSILPFLQPIPLPGLSSLLGIVALFQGIGLIFFKKPLLTQRMKKLVISREKFESLCFVAEKLERFTDAISFYSHPASNSRLGHIFCGTGITLAAAFLCLPLPIPLSNFVPALSIALICIGLLEQDLFLITIGLGIVLALIGMGIFSFYFMAEKFPYFFS
jgi:hypothetical protein